MEQTAFFEFIKQCHLKEEEITRKKNGDYSPQSDALSNFRRYGENQLLSRIWEKFQRLENIISSGKINCDDEQFEDTVFDLSNYCHLLLAYVKEKKEHPVLVGCVNKSPRMIYYYE